MIKIGRVVEQNLSEEHRCGKFDLEEKLNFRVDMELDKVDRKYTEQFKITRRIRIFFQKSIMIKIGEVVNQHLSDDHRSRKFDQDKKLNFGTSMEIGGVDGNQMK